RQQVFAEHVEDYRRIEEDQTSKAHMRRPAVEIGIPVGETGLTTTRVRPGFPHFRLRVCTPINLVVAAAAQNAHLFGVVLLRVGKLWLNMLILTVGGTADHTAEAAMLADG